MKNNKYYVVSVFAELDKKNINKEPTSSGFSFEVPRVLSPDSFFKKDGSPNKMSCFFISKMLAEAISANIHQAHELGYLDSAKHLREVIEILEKLFVANFNLDIGDISPNDKKK